jgi:hypothetical protein
MLWCDAVSMKPSSVVFLALCRALKREGKEVNELIEHVRTWPAEIERILPEEEIDALFLAHECELLGACNTLMIKMHKFVGTQMAHLLAQPGLSGLHTLRLHRCTLNLGDTGLFTRATSLTQLTTLELVKFRPGKCVLSQMAWIEGLEELVIIDCKKLTYGDYFSSSAASSLKRLVVCTHDRELQLSTSLASSKTLGNLESLEIHNPEHSLDIDSFRIAQNEALTSLSELRFRSSVTVPHNLFYGKTLPNLRRYGPIEFESWLFKEQLNATTARNMLGLATAPFFDVPDAVRDRMCEVLKSDPNVHADASQVLRPRPVKAVKDATLFTELEHICFGGLGELDHQVVYEALQAGVLDHLKSLKCWSGLHIKSAQAPSDDAHVLQKAAYALSERPMARMESVNLQLLKVYCDKAFHEFMQSECMSNLTSLTLNFCRVEGEQDVTPVTELAPGKLKGLRTLNLSGTIIDVKAAESLIESGCLDTLEVLNLAWNGLLDEAFEVLWSASTYPCLHTLTLGAVNPRHKKNVDRVTSHTAQLIGAHPALARLKVLELKNLWIDEQGARAILESPHFKGLDVLDLTKNPIEDAYLQTLFDAPPLVMDLRLTPIRRKSASKKTAQR